MLVGLSQVVQAAPKADLWPIWDTAGQATGIDHTVWQSILQHYVVRGEDGINRVDYHKIRMTGRPALTQYLQAMQSIDPRDFTRDEQMAYWINLYNALTIDVVLNYPSKGSILRMGKKFFAIGQIGRAHV